MIYKDDYGLLVTITKVSENWINFTSCGGFIVDRLKPSQFNNNFKPYRKNYMDTSKLSPVKSTDEYISEKLNRDLLEGTRNGTIVWKKDNTTTLKGKLVEFRSNRLAMSKGLINCYSIIVDNRWFKSDVILEKAIVNQRDSMFFRMVGELIWIAQNYHQRKAKDNYLKKNYSKI